MILSERGGFIFVHNPKAGGMSMRRALAAWDDSDGFFDGWAPYPEAGRRLDRMHLTLAQLRRHHPQTFAKFDRLWAFGFVRDPYQRLCSSFSQHLTLTTPTMRDAIRGDRDLFFHALNRFVPLALAPGAVEGDVRLTHFTPQSAFFALDGRAMVEAARLERPETWPDRVRELLGETGPKRLNQTPGRDAEGYDVSRLERAAIDRANAYYAEDFERFGFDRM